MTPLSNEERAGLVAEIAEVEAEIERHHISAAGMQACVLLNQQLGDKRGEIRSVRQGLSHLAAIDALRARLTDLKRREASSDV